jgi:hypothetical protein
MDKDEISVRSFDSYEEMMEDQQKREEEAVAHTLDKQWEITWGSYFFRVASDIPIFTYCYTKEEVIELEMEAGASEEEAVDYTKHLERLHNLGYRWGIHHSDVEPDGELGSAHIVSAWPITAEDFDFAQNNGWLLSPQAYNRIQNEIEEAVKASGQSFGV